MYARELMSSPVQTISAEATIGDAAEIMVETGKSCLPVVNRTGHLVGIITHTALCLHRKFLPLAGDLYALLGAWTAPKSLEDTAHDVRNKVIRDVMTHPVVVATPETPVAEVVELMLREKVNRLPILEGGELVGIITRHDLVKLLLEETGQGSARA